MLKNDINIIIIILFYEKSITYARVIKTKITLFMKKFNNEILPVIGMSPGNSYFTQETILRLIEKTLSNYSSAVIFIPDIPAISTYEALGYPLNKAKAKAVLKGNNLKNKVKSALNQLDYSEENIYVLDWSLDVARENSYTDMYNQLQKIFDTNAGFRSQILSTTLEVLKNSDKSIADLHTACLKGSRYILAEFAFLEICSELFSSNEARYIYHKDWPVYEDYISGKFDGITRKHLSFEKTIII